MISVMLAHPKRAIIPDIRTRRPKPVARLEH